MGGLGALELVRVPRWLGCPLNGREIHGFADASERAYAAVVYLRVRRDSKEDDWAASLVMAKTRVASLRQVSLPRLELCAATLLVRWLMCRWCWPCGVLQSTCGPIQP